MIDFSKCQFAECDMEAKSIPRELRKPWVEVSTGWNLRVVRTVSKNQYSLDGTIEEVKRVLKADLWYKTYGDLWVPMMELKRFVYMNSDRCMDSQKVDEAFAPLLGLLKRPA